MNILDKLNHKSEWKLKNIAFSYPGDVFEEFWVMRSWELITISSWSNQWKTTFVYRILEENKTKWTAMINMEFDLEEWFAFEYFKSLWIPDNKLKLMWTDEKPLTEQEEYWLQEYIKKRKSAVEIHDLTQQSTADSVIKLLLKLYSEWKTLVAIDSLTSIDWVADSIWKQVDMMQRLRNFVTDTWMSVILIHHFNKWGKTYSWSAKIKDLSNVLINIYFMIDIFDMPYRLFVLDKDKAFWQKKILHIRYSRWDYVLVPEIEEWELPDL